MFLHFYISASSSSQLHAYQTSISLPNSQATLGCKLIAKSLKTNKPTKAPAFWSPWSCICIDPLSGIEVRDKMGEGVGWGVDSKVLKEMQSPLFLDQNPPRFHQNWTINQGTLAFKSVLASVHASWNFSFKGNIPCKGRMNSNILIISKTN